MKRFLWIIAFLMLLVGGGTALAQFGIKSLAQGEGPLKQSVLIDIPPGTNLRTISDHLAEKGVIYNARVFQIYARLTGRGTSLKAGEYQIPARASTEQVLEILTSGVSVDRRVTFPEGLTVFEIVEKLSDTKGLTGDITTIPEEGSLFPNTYYYTLRDSREDIIKRMQTTMETQLARLWDERDPDLPIKTPEEALILASIVEKETAQPEEYPVVASVYLNRLRKNMKLDADPTVIYGLSGGTGSLGRALTLKDLKVKSPYNTYRNKGLPPSPICNPGLGAIEGVLQPAPTDYLFFVADGTGGHAFAKTYKEHQQNVKKWRQINR